MGKHERNSIPHQQKTLIGRSIEPNENITVPIGPVTLARMVIEELRLPPVLDSMKSLTSTDSPYKRADTCAIYRENMSKR